MPPLDPARFLAAMAELPSGVTVTTCRDARGAPVGATLSAVTSLSLDPPMVLACFDRNSNTLRAVIEPGSPFLVHILARGQEAIAMAFAGKGGDKFDAVPWAPGRLGLPQIAGCAAGRMIRVISDVPLTPSMRPARTKREPTSFTPNEVFTRVGNSAPSAMRKTAG